MWGGLLDRGLIDELRLMVSPTVIGEGTPTFRTPVDLTLVDTRRFTGSDNVLLVYAPKPAGARRSDE